MFFHKFSTENKNAFFTFTTAGRWCVVTFVTKLTKQPHFAKMEIFLKLYFNIVLVSTKYFLKFFFVNGGRGWWCNQKAKFEDFFLFDFRFFFWLKMHFFYFISEAALSLAILTLVISDPAFALIRSNWAFWLFNSPPMSLAIFLKLPIMALTCSIFSSISSSRASLVILATKAPLGISTPGAGGGPPATG